MINMTNLKNVFKEVKIPRPQISARSAYSTTPIQRREYLSGIQKARSKAMEYNKYINKQRLDYIKNQEAYQRKLAELKKATQQYDVSRRDIQQEISSLESYERQLEQEYKKIQAEKERASRSSRRSSRSRGTSYFRFTKDKPSPITSKMKSSTKVSKPSVYKSPIKKLISSPLDRFM